MNEQKDWWLGMADLLASGSGHGVEKIKRVHLAIADESFQALDAFAVTRPWARVVKQSHDGISGLCYGAVQLGFQSIGAALSTTRPPAIHSTSLSGDADL